MQEAKKPTLREELVTRMTDKMNEQCADISHIYAQAAGLAIIFGIFVAGVFHEFGDEKVDPLYAGGMTFAGIFLAALYSLHSRMNNGILETMKRNMIKLQELDIEKWFRLEKQTVQYFTHTLHFKDCWDQEHVIEIKVNAERTLADEYFWQKAEEDFELRRTQQGFPPPHWQTAMV